jgi:UDP-N-acetylglucosamine--N-acetylmuramyl-(pentapeptide) pyrophosphoryl-undecaprenol N-acetylglucosamine transferase
MKPLRIIIAGGGTGGHVFPAIAIAEEIRNMRPDAEILFIGTKKKIEARVIPQRGYPFHPIWISGWSRKIKLESIVFPLKVIVAMYQSYVLMKAIKPAIVVGTGGYVCGPVVRMARHLDIPTLIQEQNSYPGVTTRMLARRVDQVHITFEETKKYLKRTDNIHVSGNPTRRELGSVTRDEAVHKFGFDIDRPVVLAFGGSLGAATINNALAEALPVIEELKIQLLWITGDQLFDRVKKIVGERAGIVLLPFLDDMASAYAAATLVICRAGATTIAELTRTGVPSILVPYPYATANHQEFNARTLADHGAARMILNENLIRDLPGALRELLAGKDELERMRENAHALGKPDAGRIIAEAIIGLARR